MRSKMNPNQLNISELGIILATRDIAHFVVETAKKQSIEAVSLADVKSVSRSFLDELYILSKKNSIDIIDIPESINPLYELIKRTHTDRKMYAPKIKVHVSDKTFA